MNKRPPTIGSDEIVERLRKHLEALKLPYTLAHLDEHLAWATRESPPPSALLEHVLAEEAALRRQSRFDRRFTNSGLKEKKTLETFDFAFQPKLDKSAILELARLEFVRRTEKISFSPEKQAPGKVTFCRRSRSAPASICRCATRAASTSSMTCTPGLRMELICVV
jgi:hypothetical protein